MNTDGLLGELSGPGRCVGRQTLQNLASGILLRRIYRHLAIGTVDHPPATIASKGDLMREDKKLKAITPVT